MLEDGGEAGQTGNTSRHGDNISGDDGRNDFGDGRDGDGGMAMEGRPLPMMDASIAEAALGTAMPVKVGIGRPEMAGTEICGGVRSGGEWN